MGADAALALAVPNETLEGSPPYAAAWGREEALGATGPPLFLDLPAPSAALLAERRAAEPKAGARLHAEWLSVKARKLRLAKQIGGMSVFGRKQAHHTKL